MTELNRIACPGCRMLLSFRPEVLHSPANCASCEARFSVGIYVRLACPGCRQGSRIREAYRGRRVRCLRCQHEFVADEGIAAGAGGRLLVARLLDTDSPAPPESVQPFVDPSFRPVPERRAAPAEAARPADEGHPPVSGSGFWPVPPPVELDRLRAEAEEARGRQAVEVAAAQKAARRADDRWSNAEGKLVEAMLELGEAEQRADRLDSEREEALAAAGLERSALLSRIDRLNAAVASATVGEAGAHRLAEEALRKFDASFDDLKAERRRGLELGRVVEDLRAEIEARKAAETVGGDAQIEHRARLDGERDALVAELERSRLEATRLLEENARLSGLVEQLRVENRSLGEDAEELRQRAGVAEESSRLRDENRRLTLAIERARSEAEGLHDSLARELERARGEPGPSRDDRGRSPLDEAEEPDDVVGRLELSAESDPAFEAAPAR